MAKRSSGEHGGGGGHDGGGSLRWLLTYADMITLLMAFFIMLYSMSILNLAKFNQVAVSIRSGFNGISEGQGRSILSRASGQFGIKPSPMDMQSAGVSDQAIKKVCELIMAKDSRKSLRLRQDERGLVISVVTDQVLFPKGQADLSPGAAQLLDKIVGILKIVPNGISVEGHTCNLPIHSTRYPTNWELSSARASRVVRYFIEEGKMPAGRFSAVGYADCRPLEGVPNTTEENRAMNRRVDVVILKSEHLR